MENVKIQLNEDKEFEKQIGEQLHQFNRKNCEYIKNNSDEKYIDTKVYNIAVYNKEELIGGATGFIRCAWYFLEQLWIKEEYRKSGIGTKIIKEIEKIAKENNALGVRMETWSFQARGFYEKMGYKVYATFEDCPPGTVDYFLKKKF